MEACQMNAASDREQRIKYVEEILLRIASHEGVIGYIVLNPADGSILKFSGFSNNHRKVHMYAEKINGFTDLVSSTVRTIDWKDDVTFIRLSVGRTDILVAPDLEKHYTLLVVQEIKE